MSIFENMPQRCWISLAVLIVLPTLIRLAGTSFEKYKILSLRKAFKVGVGN